MSDDAKTLWREQPEEKLAVHLQHFVNRRTQELYSTTRAEILTSIGEGSVRLQGRVSVLIGNAATGVDEGPVQVPVAEYQNVPRAAMVAVRGPFDTTLAGIASGCIFTPSDYRGRLLTLESRSQNIRCPLLFGSGDRLISPAEGERLARTASARGRTCWRRARGCSSGSSGALIGWRCSRRSGRCSP